MTPDKISDVAQKDDLIVTLGNLWMRRNIGNKLKRCYYSSSRMRQMGRFLINFRKVSENESATMRDCIQPGNFDFVARAAMMAANQDMDDVEDLRAPSTAIKLGYDIKRIALAKCNN
jgi:hypothetical protein